MYDAPQKEKRLTPMENTGNNKSLNLVSEKRLPGWDLVQCYLSEVGQFKLLSREKERELAIRFKKHRDRNAGSKLVASNLRLVVKIAIGYHRAWRIYHLLDLIQEGSIGLMLAINRFDPHKNVKLSHYASFWIKAHILRFIMTNFSIVKLGTTRSQRKLFFRLKKEKQKMIDQGCYPGPKLLSERFGLSERDIVEMDQRLHSWDVSLNAALKDDPDRERIDLIKDAAKSIEDRISKNEIYDLLHKRVAEFRRTLTKRDLEIFDLRIFSDNPLTLQALGARYGISRQRVRQLEMVIIKKMRKKFSPEFRKLISLNEIDEMEIVK